MDKISGSDSIGLSKFYQLTDRFSARDFEEWLSKKFIDKNGSIKEEFAKTHVNCPICSTSLENSFKVFNKSGYIHWKCKNCESIYTNPTLHDVVIETKVYGKTDYPFFNSVNSVTQKEFDHSRFTRALEIIRKVNINKSNNGVFDFGCGSGYFLSLCRDYGYKYLLGNDLIDRAVKFANSEYQLEDVLLKNANEDIDRINSNISLIGLWEILDHVNNPLKLLDSILNKIDSGTYIILSVRNADSIAARILKSECNMFLGHAHFNFWSNRAIDNLINRGNLECIEYYQYISEREVVCNFLNFENPYSGSGNDISWIPSVEDIIKLRLGYKHVLVLRKV